jgi:PilZ domain-containing protein
VNFPSGHELLGSYWGLLANGGLVLDEDEAGLKEGDFVELEVTLGTAGETYRLKGRVVRTPQSASRHGRVVIAFNPGEPHDVLLSAAWADTEHVPARRTRRFPLDVDIRFHSTSGEEARGRIVNLSFGGCCLRVTRGDDQARAAVGEPLTLISQRSKLNGVVRWSEGSCRGIEFQDEGDQAAVEHFVKQFL